MHRRYRLLSVVTAAALTLAGVTAIPAQAATGVLSGVVHAPDGTPVSTCVNADQASDHGYTSSFSTCTDEDGRWELPGLPLRGQFKVFIAGVGNLAQQWADNGTTIDDGDLYPVGSTILTTLQPDATFRGRLVDAQGNGVPTTSVRIRNLNDAEYDDDNDITTLAVRTDSTARWSAAVPKGDYTVLFHAGLVPFYAFDRRTREDAHVFHAVPGGTVVVNDRVPLPGHVKGLVVDEITGAPIKGVCATLIDPSTYDPASPADEQTGRSEYLVGSGCTDATGHYAFPTSGLGSFAVQLIDPSGRYAGEYSGDTRTVSLAKTKPMVEDGYAFYKAKLARGATVTGRVLNAAGPRALVCPRAYVGRTSAVAFGPPVECSEADGTYTLKGLPKGELTVRLKPSFIGDDTTTSWYRGAALQSAARLVVTAAGQVEHLQDTALVAPGSISGTVTDTAGHPIADATVDLVGYLGRYFATDGGYIAFTDRKGRFTLEGLPAGTYRPMVSPPVGDPVHAPVWSGGSNSLAGATPVTVNPGATTPFSFVLPDGGFVTGQFVGAGHAHLLGPVETTAGDLIGDFDVSPLTGTFRTSPLPAGSYVLSVALRDRTSAYFDATKVRSEAIPVTLTLGQTTTLTWHITLP